jgi:hypothetical protein
MRTPLKAGDSCGIHGQKRVRETAISRVIEK